MKTTLNIHHFGCADYATIWQQMRDFTAERRADTPDELWLGEHFPVFTQGQAGRAEHVLNPGSIPLVQTDRGGQITYHGPGQLMAYALLDLQRLKITVRDLVCGLERSVIATLAEYGVNAQGRRDAPGVYVDGAKICSIGLRVRRGYSYHGLALNIDMDLEPFSRINPCGFQGLAMTQLAALSPQPNLSATATKLVRHFCKNFGYNEAVQNSRAG